MTWNPYILLLFREMIFTLVSLSIVMGDKGYSDVYILLQMNGLEGIYNKVKECMTECIVECIKSVECIGFIGIEKGCASGVHVCNGSV